MAHIIKGDGKAIFGLVLTYCGPKDVFNKAGFSKYGRCPKCRKKLKEIKNEKKN